jgi:hypothetical protein
VAVDYYPLIARAVHSLDINTPETRDTIYERARLVQKTHLQAAPNATDRLREQDALERAILRVEAENASEQIPAENVSASRAVVSFKYRAFISYSHKDRKSCEWLHRSLEGFRIDKDLVGRHTSAGDVPPSLRPIFRDRDDFSAGHSLTVQTRTALDASQFLIVLCSPNSAASQYVNDEIRYFKMVGRSHQIVAVIIGGEPNDPNQECFPLALKAKVRRDGQVTNVPEEPIASDIRSSADGKRNAVTKTVAALIGLPFDDVRKREAIAERRRAVYRVSVGAALVGLAVVAGLLFYERQQQSTVLAGQITNIQSAVEKQKQESQKLLASVDQKITDSTIYAEDKWGAWTAAPIMISNLGNSYCSMANGVTNKGANQNIVLKSYAKPERMNISLYKDKWNRPKDSVVNVEFDFTDNEPLVLKAYANAHILDATIPEEVLAVFLSLMRERPMQIIFPDGNEPTWFPGQVRIEEALKQFVQCSIDNVKQNRQPPTPKH